MKDPIRWCDTEGSADEFEREVLRADRAMAPDEHEAAVVWAKLAGELGLSGALFAKGADPVQQATGAAVGSQSVGTAALTLAFLKGLGAGVLVSSALWGGARLLDRREASSTASPAAIAVANGVTSVSVGAPGLRGAEASPEPAPPAPLRSAQPTRVSRERPPNESKPSMAGEGVAPSNARFDEAEAVGNDGVPSPRDSELKEEALLLARARQQLRAGQLGNARQALEESRHRFAAPQLRQEREALTIELLFRDGQKLAAAARAKAFLQAFPQSPHTERVQTFAASSR